MIPLLLLLGCGPPVDPLACTAAVNERVTTVVHVTCTAATELEEPVSAEVAFGAGAYTDRTPAQTLAPGASATFDLYGVPGGVEVWWRAEAADGAVEGRIENGPLPPELAGVEVTVPDAGSGGPRFLLGSFFGSQPANFVLDRDGNYVWYRLLDAELWPIELRWSHTDDTPTLLANEFAIDHGIDLGQIRRLTLTGEEIATYDPVDSHHMFTELGPEAGAAAGTVAYLAIDVRDWTDPETKWTGPVVGDKVVEVAPDGTQTTIWSIWDWREVTKSFEFDIPFYPQGRDWSHGNSLHYYADTDTYTVSFNNLAVAVEFRRADGVPVRWFGPGEAPPEGLGIAEGSLEWHHPHDVQLRADGRITAFSTNPETGDAGGVEYAIDAEAGVLRETWRGGFGAELPSAFLGQVEPLDNGNVLVNYGAGRVVAELTRDDQVAWAISSEVANFFAQVHPFESFYEGR